jgi:hypothetical protein
MQTVTVFADGTNVRSIAHPLYAGEPIRVRYQPDKLQGCGEAPAVAKVLVHFHVNAGADRTLSMKPDHDGFVAAKLPSAAERGALDLFFEATNDTGCSVVDDNDGHHFRQPLTLPPPY